MQVNSRACLRAFRTEELVGKFIWGTVPRTVALIIVAVVIYRIGGLGLSAIMRPVIIILDLCFGCALVAVRIGTVKAGRMVRRAVNQIRNDYPADASEGSPFDR